MNAPVNEKAVDPDFVRHDLILRRDVSEEVAAHLLKLRSLGLSPDVDVLYAVAIENYMLTDDYANLSQTLLRERALYDDRLSKTDDHSLTVDLALWHHLTVTCAD